jgi:3D-(3,5/4)-trihydroxycyclohexane-1,2-dione acylhydrolase (decyclizing)
MRHRAGALGEGALEGEYVQLDLASVAAGLGARTFAASTVDEVRAALAAAREHDGPSVIVVPTVPHEFLPGSGCWWDVAPAAVSDQPWVADQRATYEHGLVKQRWFG